MGFGLHFQNNMKPTSPYFTDLFPDVDIKFCNFRENIRQFCQKWGKRNLNLFSESYQLKEKLSQAFMQIV